MDSPFSQINSYMQKLPRSSGKLDGLLIGRLVVSALLLAAVQFMDLLPGLIIVLMLLSVLIAGYDVLLDLVDAVLNHDFFSASAVMVLITVLSFLISTGLEGDLVPVGACACQFCHRQDQTFRAGDAEPFRSGSA